MTARVAPGMVIGAWLVMLCACGGTEASAGSERVPGAGGCEADECGASGGRSSAGATASGGIGADAGGHAGHPPAASGGTTGGAGGLAGGGQLADAGSGGLAPGAGGVLDAGDASFPCTATAECGAGSVCCAEISGDSILSTQCTPSDECPPLAASAPLCLTDLDCPSRRKCAAKTGGIGVTGACNELSDAVDDAAMVECGSATCAIELGLRCCDPDDRFGLGQCATACNIERNFYDLACDEPADCPGAACRLRYPASPDPRTRRSAMSCSAGSTGVAVNCRRHADCGAGQVCCIGSTDEPPYVKLTYVQCMDAAYCGGRENPLDPNLYFPSCNGGDICPEGMTCELTFPENVSRCEILDMCVAGPPWGRCPYPGTDCVLLPGFDGIGRCE